MITPNAFVDHFDYFVKRDVDKFFIAIAIRNLAMGMILIFEPIYLFLFFNKEISYVLFFYAALFGLYGIFSVFGAKFIARFGAHMAILVSYGMYMVYYVSLFLFPESFIFVPTAVLFGAIAMALFWPSFHIDFVRFSSSKSRGKDVGKVGLAALLPTVLSPFIGGWILASFGYPFLFVVVLVVLMASIIPLAYTKKTNEVYTDNFDKVWNKVFSKKRWRQTLAFSAATIELGVASIIWPLFMFTAAISFSFIGGITSASLLASGIFILYIGKLSDTKDRPWLLNIGAVWTSIAWIIKSFVTTAFDALLSDMIYKVSKGAGNIPFQTFFYETAGSRKEMADEFIIYRTVVIGLARFTFLTILGIVFFFFPLIPLQSIFFVGAVAALGFMFLQNKLTIAK